MNPPVVLSVPVTDSFGDFTKLMHQYVPPLNFSRNQPILHKNGYLNLMELKLQC
ncbi:hypothetical protein ANACOL_04401 [Anaerotruncus colihominis DSM 17241]|uniref:Uncharacterized protein n=1 Tax=Anaerotruncus colihominis DSM 17241 TaxID=445972 RepID=B0PHV8_9FIRM|nr:hypothetical protein ANACOL_04401 [Anaerotruncus colihominis DSM 17241]